MASQTLENLVIRVDPEIAPYVNVTPKRFDTIRAGDAVPVNLMFSASQAAFSGDFSGIIQLRSSVPPRRAFGRPFQVKIKVIGQNLTFDQPDEWNSRIVDDIIVLADESTQASEGPPEFGADVPPALRMQLYANPENLSASAFGDSFADGWFLNYIGGEEIQVGNKTAVLFDDRGSGIGHGPVLAAFIPLTDDRMLLLSAPGYEEELSLDRVIGFNDVLFSVRP